MGRRTNSRITLWGTSFAKIGDEAQIVSTLSLVRELVPDSDVVVLDKPRAQSRQFHTDVQTLRLLKLWRALPRIMRSDLLLVIGAPFFETFRQMINCLLVIGCARMAGTPVVCYGVTLFEIRSPWARLFFRHLLRGVATFAVRESVGIGTLSDLGVCVPARVAEDQRVLLRPADTARVEALLRASGVDPQKPVIGVTTRYVHEAVPLWVKRLQGYKEARNRQAMSTLGRLMNTLSHQAQLLVIPMHPSFSDDEAMTARINDFLEDPARLRVLLSPFSASDCLGIIRHCDMLISSRLSSTLFAQISGTPVVAIAYDSRSIELMSRQGLEERVFLWSRLDFQRMLEVSTEVWTKRETHKQALREGNDQSMRRARAEGRLLLSSLR